VGKPPISKNLAVRERTEIPQVISAGELYERMGRGGLLRVPRGGGTPTIHVRRAGQFNCGVARFNWKAWDSQPVLREAVDDLASAGFIHKLTEHGEPPLEHRKKGEGWRDGWREMHLDGETADWWVCTQ
jgi:hypothetical protein